MGKDMVCLADGYVFETDPAISGINDNVISVGTTGCGKTVSYSESRLLHTEESSLVVPIAKRKIKNKYKKVFEKKGYKVIDIDLAHPENSEYGYDPLDYVHTEEEIMNLARQVALCGEKSEYSSADPYWDDAATNVIAAAINLLLLNSADGGEKVSFDDLLQFIHKIETTSKVGNYATNVDCLFDKAEAVHPGNNATRLWKVVKGNSTKTAGCIMSKVYQAVGSLLTGNVAKLTQMADRIDFGAIGNEKTIVFLTTSPVNKCLQNFADLFYGDLFKSLFDEAESKDEGRLPVPVHVICDDFACGSKIVGFEEYISIFRAAGISVSLLLQSESQLNAIYGQYAATTIINNCDTYLYMGGNDITTCKNISIRLNKPVDKILNMPLEQVVVFRRGREPIISKRYQTYADPIYIAEFEQVENENI